MKKRGITCSSFLALCAFAMLAGAEPEVAKLDWMSGHWCGYAGDERIEEYWSSSHGGVMLGLSRTLKGERTANFEFMRIVMVGSVVRFIAQPGGKAPTSFIRSAGGLNWVRFENPEHDFPRRIEYRRDGKALHAEIAGPGANGKEQVISFNYMRCTD